VETFPSFHWFRWSAHQLVPGVVDGYAYVLLGHRTPVIVFGTVALVLVAFLDENIITQQNRPLFGANPLSFLHGFLSVAQSITVTSMPLSLFIISLVPPIRVPQTQSAFHPHAQRTVSRRRDVRRQRRLFARENPRLRRSPNSIRLC
jgi:hypothetical protein